MGTRVFLTISVVCCVCLAHAFAYGETIYVDGAGGGDYLTIQDGISASVSGDVVLVAAGIYTGTDNRSLDFAGRGITLESEDGPEVTIIDCEEIARGFWFHTHESASAVVQGFTVRNGRASVGGGALLNGSSPTFTECVFASNTATSEAPFNGGGAIYCISASPTITDVTFTMNDGYRGAAISCRQGSDPAITNSRFLDNTSEGAGGALYCREYSAPHVIDSVFMGGSATSGGAIFCDEGHPTFIRCWFEGNESIADHSNSGGGAINAYKSNATLSQCTFVGNTAVRGGAVFCRDPYLPTIDHCTFYGNSSPNGSSIYSKDSELVVTNSIFSYGTLDVAVECEGPSDPTIIHSCSYGNEGGDVLCGSSGEILYQSPYFCDPPSGDFQLDNSSPCAPFNNPWGELIGAHSVGCGDISTWYVDVGNTSGTEDGSWDFPFSAIYYGLDAAENDHTVMVAPGVYSGELNRDLDFGGKRVVLESVQGSAETVIDCEGVDRGFIFQSGEDTTSVIRGFTVRNGTADNGGAVSCVGGSSPLFEDVIFDTGIASSNGGGMYCIDSSSPTLRYSRFDGNVAANDGGGLYCHNTSSPRLLYCTFHDNGANHDGGGLYCDSGSEPILTHVSFNGNGTFLNNGGGIRSVGCSPSLDSVIVAFSTNGGGIYADGFVTPTVTCSDVYGNTGGDYVGMVDQTGLNGNISEDPLFCFPTGGNLTLSGESPCAAYANSCGVLMGAHDVGCDFLTTIHTIAPDGSGDFMTIQTALNSPDVRDDDVIELTDGVFFGPGNRDVDFNGKLVTVRSQSGDPETCVIDCEGESGSPHRGFLFENAEDELAVVQDLTIRNGYLPEGEGGAGVFCDGSSPTIRNIVFSHCSSSSGGAVSCINGSAPLIEACMFVSNSAHSYHGGGVACFDGSGATIDGCTFTSNSASNKGGGVHCEESAVTITDCTFNGNWVASSSGIYGGGAIHCLGEPATTITGCTLYANSSTRGGGIFSRETTPLIENTIIAFSEEGSAIHCYTASDAPDISCTDIFGNPGGDWDACVAPQYGVSGNISEDPLFCERLVGDLTISDSSPCAPDNNACGVLIGSQEVGCSLEPMVWVVAPDGSGDFPTIQAAFDAAEVENNDVIELTDGVFEGDGNRDIDFGGKSVVLAGQSGDARACVLDCGGSLEEPHRGFHFQSGETATSAVRDITIAGGHAGVEGAGGGILCEGAWPTFERVILSGNVAETGGGLACLAASAPIVVGCGIVDNTAARGGGVWCEDGTSVTMESSTLSGNRASEGGGLYCDGSSSASLTFSIAWGDSAGTGMEVYADAMAFVSFSCSDLSIQGGWGPGQVQLSGTNYFDDPLFCGDRHPDNPYTLRTDSPCAADNSPVCGLIGAFDVACYLPRTLVVDCAGGGDYETIGEAVAASADGDTVLVRPCVYSGPLNRNIDPGGREILILSSAGPESTIIDCEGEGRAFLFQSGESETTVLRGFTIEYGFAATGGGIACVGSSPTIEEMILLENQAITGGGLYCEMADPEIINVTLVANSAVYGSGMAFDESSPTIRNAILAYQPSGEVVSCLDGASVPSFTRSCVYGNADGDSLCGDYGDNIYMRPLFCDYEGGDLTLRDDSQCLPGNNAWGELVGALGLGTCPTFVPEGVMPTRLALYHASPNPFHPPTEIAYDIPEPSRVNLRIYDVSGRLVRELKASELHVAGRHATMWDGKDDRGKRAASGVYFYRIEVGEETIAKRMLLLR